MTDVQATDALQPSKGFTALPPEVISIVYDELLSDKDDDLPTLAALSQTAVYPSKCAQQYLYPIMRWSFKSGREDRERWLSYLVSSQRQFTEYLLIDKDELAHLVHWDFQDAQRRGGVPNTLVCTLAVQDRRVVARFWKESGFKNLPEAVARLCRQYRNKINVRNAERVGVTVNVFTQQTKSPSLPLLLNERFNSARPTSRNHATVGLDGPVRPAYRLPSPPLPLARNQPPRPSACAPQSPAGPASSPAPQVTPTDSPLFGSPVTSAASVSPFPFDRVATPRPDLPTTGPSTPTTSNRASGRCALPLTSSPTTLSDAAGTTTAQPGLSQAIAVSAGMISTINLSPSEQGSPLPNDLIVGAAQGLSIRNREQACKNGRTKDFGNCALNVRGYINWKQRDELGSLILLLCASHAECFDTDLSFHIRCEQNDRIPTESEVLAFVDIFFSSYVASAARLLATRPAERSLESWPKLRIAISHRCLQSDVTILLYPSVGWERTEVTVEYLDGWDDYLQKSRDWCEVWDECGNQIM